ncbi:hypothetical protein EON63_04650 [archaeon]|nr:MAG: hypothetical protein EON63_04650 [archaeon]
MWDTAGQERFATILASHLRGAHGVMLVYDVANRASFEAIRDKYLPQVDSLAEPNVAKVLMGHAKADSLSDQRVKWNHCICI